MQITEATNYKSQVLALLGDQKLPVSDIPGSLNNFVIAIEGGEVIGVAGLEVYSNYGLLRSLAVRPEFRGKKIAGKLISRIEAMSFSKGLKAIYLLTETAAGYFKLKFYEEVKRDDVPAEVQASSEFSHVCPQSAIVMKKTLSV